MKPITITHSEEYKGTTKVFLSNSTKVSFPTEKLIQFIEQHEMNVVEESVLIKGTGNVADPNNEEEEVLSYIPVEKYLDDNWPEIIAIYFSKVLSKE